MCNATGWQQEVGYETVGGASARRIILSQDATVGGPRKEGIYMSMVLQLSLLLLDLAY